jgi:hypothetical protein
LQLALLRQVLVPLQPLAQEPPQRLKVLLLERRGLLAFQALLLVQSALLAALKAPVAP